jgi:hypothetical protein
MNESAASYRRFASRSALCAALPIVLGFFAAAFGQQPTPPSGGWLDPSGAAVILPDVDGAEPLTLPGSPITETLEALPTESVFIPSPQKLSAYKNGFFQKLSLAVDWLGNEGDAADLGITEFRTFVQVGLPAPIREWPMLVTAGFDIDIIKGPTITDLPSRLYLTYVDFMWVPQIVRGYTILLAAAPSVFGDFTAHEFRLTGKGLLIVDWVPDRLQLIAGVLYLNRENILLLPAGGIIWSPTDWTRFEILFPKPKFGVRVNVGPGYEDWIYTTAEFGGNTWPVIRTGGVHDNVTYVDYRILVGFERKLDGGAGYRLEAGYVFGRDITFTTGNGDFSPQDTIMLRGGIAF